VDNRFSRKVELKITLIHNTADSFDEWLPELPSQIRLQFSQKGLTISRKKK
jgi:hypothetical protein